MMDLSDGLSMDLYRMCEASGCWAELHAAPLEQAIRLAARNLAQTAGGTPLEHALNDGEDFELLIAGEETLSSAADSLIPIGIMRPASAPVHSTLMTLIHPDGRRELLEPRGYEHWK